MPAAKKAASGIYRCKQSFSAQNAAGEIFTFHTGELIEADNPVFKEKGWSELFAPVEDQFRSAAVETATAAPGEKRGA